MQEREDTVEDRYRSHDAKKSSDDEVKHAFAEWRLL